MAAQVVGRIPPPPVSPLAEVTAPQPVLDAAAKAAEVDRQPLPQTG